MIFKQPNEKEFEQVKQWVEDFWLDNGNMQPEQFSVLSDNGKVIAFGRLKEHADATELCTMGVAKEFQSKGFGEKMVKHLISQATQDVHLVTIIPKFFANCGFALVENYPVSLQRKIDLCKTHYHVEEPYHVMKWEKKDI